MSSLGLERDRLDIIDTITAYFVALDHREFDALHRVFTPDAEADFDGTAAGPGCDAIIGHVSGLRNYQLSHHQISNHVARIDGDHAWSETYATAYLVDATDTGPRCRTRGLRYQDELARTAAGWRIQRRVHVCDWMRLGPLESAAPAITPLPDPLMAVLDT